MKLLADECVAESIVERLRTDGHEVEWINEVAKSSKDIPVLNRAIAQHVPLLTQDLDFGRYIFGEGYRAPHEGVVQYRLPHALPHRQGDIISRFFRQHDSPDLYGFFVTIDDEDSYRLRPLP